MLSADCPVVLDIEADNRGLITITLDQIVILNTVNAESVQVFTAGDDLIFDTEDDVLVDSLARATVGDNGQGEIVIAADIETDSRLKVRLDGSIIQSLNGFLDGEFNGAGVPSGDGVAGGDLVFFTRVSARPVARFITTLGDVDVQLFPDQTPLSVANFLSYANTGRYDATIIHRNVAGFVVQGGGFDQDTFDSVELDPPVTNEPALSNVRGTIAIAKMPNDPNSGTSQWFFNVGNNSGNLDNQNGGFTVFGEIVDAAGLEVVDAINALLTIPARSLNPAFGETPVTNPDADFLSVTAEDLVEVLRVSTLMDIFAAPPEELAGASRVISSEGAARVTFFDLTGDRLDQIDEMVTINFTRNGDRVSSIVIEESFPIDGVGISISGADRVGSIIDKRRDGGNLAFVVSTVPVESIRIQGQITGANLNGRIIAGAVLPEDIDRDGSSDDMTGVFVMRGFVNRVELEGLTGDLVIPGGAGTLRVDGRLENLDIVLNGDDAGDRTLTVRGQSFRNVDLTTDQRISELRIEEWTDTDGVRDRLRAASAGVINITGSRDRDGDFEADILFLEAPVDDLGNRLNTLDRLIVRGDMVGSRLQAAGGPVERIDVKGNMRNVEIEDVLVMRKLQAGSVENVDLTVSGPVELIRVSEWFGGDVTVDGAAKIITTGDRGAGVEGHFAANLTVANNTGFSEAVRVMKVKGDVFLADWVIDRGDMRQLTVGGDIFDTNISVGGSLRKLQAGELQNVDASFAGEVRQVRVDAWVGGSFTSGEVSKFVVKGDLSADITSTFMKTLDIHGDVTSADLDFNGQPQSERDINIRRLNVRGDVLDTNIRAEFFLGNVTLGSMRDSTIMAGVRESVFGFPQDLTSGFQFSSIDRLAIKRVPGEETFVNSFVVAAGLLDVSLGEVNPMSFTGAFGVGGLQFNQLTYFMDGRRVEFSTTSSDPNLNTRPENVGQFEVRVTVDEIQMG